MATWWYAEKEEKVGPVTVDDLKRLVHNGKIRPGTMLWQEGMESWRRLDDINELQALLAAIPPPLPAKTKPDPRTYPLATRWPRFLARTFDLWWQIGLLSFLLGMVLGRYSAAFVESISKPGATQLFALAVLPLALVLDASLYRVLGNSPGKALLGLKVGTLDAQRLTFAQYVGRNLSLWVQGLALGIPILNLVTFARQSRRLSKGQSASYDEDTGYRVRAKPIGGLRKTFFGVCFVALLTGISVIDAMDQQSQRNTIRQRQAAPYAWENPVSRVSATIDPRWTHSSTKNDSGQTIYVFSEQADRAGVAFAVEHRPGYSLGDYVRAFKQGNASNMEFNDGGRFFERNTQPMWQSSGRMVDNSSSRLTVQIAQNGASFWRVVAIQTMPHDYSDKMVNELQSALWGTLQ